MITNDKDNNITWLVSFYFAVGMEVIILLCVLMGLTSASDVTIVGAGISGWEQQGSW